jgi:hypothetical protein
MTQLIPRELFELFAIVLWFALRFLGRDFCVQLYNYSIDRSLVWNDKPENMWRATLNPLVTRAVLSGHRRVLLPRLAQQSSFMARTLGGALDHRKVVFPLMGPDERRKGNEQKHSSTQAQPVEQRTEVLGEPFLRSIGFHPDQLVAPAETNRFIFAPAAMANHFCLGSIFAWSVFNEPLTSLHGVLTPAASDWTLAETAPVFSLVMGGFVWGAVFSKYLDAWGPRACCMIGAAGLGGGFGLVALGSSLHSIPLLYLGGLTWGLCNGWAYVPPVATLLKWFPDRKGLASGMCIMGYGGGASLCTFASYKLLRYYREAPEYLGSQSEIAIQNIDGKLFAEVAEQLREVVIATSANVASWADEGLVEGVYAVGTGSTGLVETLTALGATYCLGMVACSFLYRLPPSGYRPASAAAAEGESSTKPKVHITSHNVAPEVASRTPQFALMYLGFGCAVTGSYGIISAGKTLMTDGFQSSLPLVVTAGFATSFVAAMSIANLSGRLFWTTVSDKLAEMKGGDPFYGRKLAYSLMWGICPPMYLGVVWSVHQCAESPSTLPLAVFTGSVMGIMASFGGTAAARPALCGDLFGLKHVGMLSARQLSVVMPAALAGPRIVATMRESASGDAIRDLASKVDDEAFANAFAAGKDQLDLLIEHNTVTIGRLMELVPPGTPDPTPFLYDNTMYLMAGIQTCAFLTNQLMTPVDPSKHEMPITNETPSLEEEKKK